MGQFWTITSIPIYGPPIKIVAENTSPMREVISHLLRKSQSNSVIEKGASYRK
jgi:hypothetical protein